MHIPHGFRFAGVHAGIKKQAQKEDFTLVHCPAGATAAGVYTQNLVFAAPVAFDRARTPASDIRVVAVNSGNANACTGERGTSDAHQMARLAAAAVGAQESQALVMSTGVIGVYLPMDKIAAGATSAAAKLGDDEAAFLSAARGILTTDKGIKVASRTLTIGGREIRLAGMCKGAGMIGPNMATMLGVVTTDAALSPDAAQSALTAAVEESFNCISVEGHMSTNDTVLLLASGAGKPLTTHHSPLTGPDLVTFQIALNELCIELAKQIPDDGEGASHLITIHVQGTKTKDDARRIAQTVANSALVKTAVAGADPNWGRIVSAAGYAGVPFDPAGVDLVVNGHKLYERGAPVPFDARTVSAAIKASRETTIELAFREGTAAIRFWTSDLNVDYVRFNADYTT
ncbi:MAG: bifunctional glutamate N-acetyltransferase/amino-acid acetyltransferase ArgJ [Planctomycetaceae bacterium]|nr:bifunctional glutamate N-acetyltransferase/amino-acid acetyltransferase ArgJ [Planctomycetaceae bacterium]